MFGRINLTEEFGFGDGTVWDVQHLTRHYVDLAKSDGDDTVYGFFTDNSHEAGWATISSRAGCWATPMPLAPSMTS
ncbi:MAG: hypothetical protein LBR29_06620, partial [Methylobacteriaceae bacterium]|nr:hypothetical protein [Methylobacteriaceae bacterium]